MTHNFVALCLPPITMTALQHSSRTRPHFMNGFAKTVWRLIQPNQTPFSLAHLKYVCGLILLLM